MHCSERPTRMPIQRVDQLHVDYSYEPVHDLQMPLFINIQMRSKIPCERRDDTSNE